MEGVIATLTYLGIAPSQLIAPLVVGGLFMYLVRKWFVKGLEPIHADATDIKASLGIIKAEVRDLHNASKEMQLHLANDGFSAQHSLDQKPLFEKYGEHHSPMKPNKQGSALLKKSHFNEAYHELQDRVFSMMDQMNLRTLYDYEAGASRALFLLSNEPEMDKVKDFAVNNPDETLELIFGIASWVIRDDYASYKKNSK